MNFAATASEFRLPSWMFGRMSVLHDKIDFFGGIDANSVTFAWAGITYAPRGTLNEDGWRVRLTGGAGHYSYRMDRAPGGINDANVVSAELLGGYRKTFASVFGATIYAAAFAGVMHENQLLYYDDPFNPTRGSETGIKGSLELYARFWERYVATGFASATTVHGKYQAKVALLRELNERWAIGFETATLGDARYSEMRGGVVGQLVWQRKIVALAVGALDNSSRGSGLYTTLSVYSPF